ncbi:MAG: ATP-binding cassette domain-containing protein, partial [Spirochaetota bacterium]|nr:ATP-binding cassette domain-containing protein [Spirochaetota bacterium]
MNELVRLEGLSFRYRQARYPILKNISLRIGMGERVLIRGRSGSGKSTLLAVMADLAPEYITGHLGGKKVLSYKTKGVVLQNPEAQIVTPTVEEEIAFALENTGLAPHRIKNRVDEVLELFHLRSLADTHPLKLSGGECQRVSLAAAFAVEPEILFLDEPTSYLDEGSSQDFFEALAYLPEKTALVVVEHRISTVSSFCTGAYEITREGSLEKSDFTTSIIFRKRRTPYETPLKKPATTLEIKNLNHRFKSEKKDLVSDIKRCLKSGMAAALLGPSGCGKSTLLGKIL